MYNNINGWKLELPQELVDKVDSEYQHKQIAPAQKDIFKAFELTGKDQVKVVIFGQDPYPTAGVATGLAFSSNNTKPASLRNMFKELESDLGIARTDTNLEDWAKQGILLLNTSLTVEIGKAGSHSKIGWQTVTDQVIEQINQLNRTVVFVLLGGHAQKLKSKISDDHLILEFVHPSPLSAYRGYFGCKMFSQINDNLVKIGYQPINYEDCQINHFERVTM